METLRSIYFAGYYGAPYPAYEAYRYDPAAWAARPCANCGYEERAPGAGWGFVPAIVRWDDCEHGSEVRYCDSCSEHWWRPGQGAEWDIDGCSHEDCPECLSTLGDDGHWHETEQPAAVRA